MKHSNTSASRPRQPRALWFLVMATIASGCQAGIDATPSASTAREALVAALDAWKQGQPAASLEARKPPVQAVDEAWRAGRKLRDYTIVSEETGSGEASGVADRRFAVKLALDGPPTDEETRYIVIGKDPVWIYRETDYERVLNMDDNPAVGKSRRKRR